MDDDLAEQLAAWERDDEIPDDLDEANPIVPVDERRVDWALERLARMASDEQRVVSFVDEEMERLVSFRDDRLTAIERRRAWVERGVEQWMRSQHRETGRKTVKLPHGEVKLRAARRRVDVVVDLDDFEQVATLDDLVPGAVIHRTEISKQEIARQLQPGPVTGRDLDGSQVVAAVTADGERVPGVYFVVPVEDTFSVKVIP